MAVRSGSPPPLGPGAIAVGEIVCGSGSASNGVTCSVAASFLHSTYHVPRTNPSHRKLAHAEAAEPATSPTGDSGTRK